MSAALWAINRKCLLHKSRRLIRATESMQSYLPARNAPCAVSYANYATRSISSAPPIVSVCEGLYPIAVWVRRGNQAASRSAAIKARDPTKWKSNCIVAVSAIRLCWCRKKLFLTSKPLNSTYLLHCPRALYLQKMFIKALI